MKNLKLSILLLFIIATFTSQAAIELKWKANAGEIKKIDQILVISGSGGYTIDWGAGEEPQSGLSYKYKTAGEYTVTISGKITTFKLTDASNSGVAFLGITEEDELLKNLFLWGNPGLDRLNIENAKMLEMLTLNGCNIEELNISKNTNLRELALISARVGDIKTAKEYPYLKLIDVNSSGVNACSLNRLYKSLPDLKVTGGSGIIYSVFCVGDADSDSNIAKNKGWKFGNGGSGNGSAVCINLPVLDPPVDINIENVSGTDKYMISWNCSGDEESYSVRVFTKGQTLCNDVFYFTDSKSIEVEIINNPEDYLFVVYAVANIYFANSAVFDFTGEQTNIIKTPDSPEFVFSESGRIIVKGVEVGATISLFKINGSFIGSKTSLSDSVEFNAESNTIYLVQTSRKVYKVMVK